METIKLYFYSVDIDWSKSAWRNDQVLGYLEVWKVLEEMMIDFKKRGGKVPSEVMRDLRSARTAIRILMVNPNGGEYAQRVEEYLTRVESYLVSDGQRMFGMPYVEKWLEKRAEAENKPDETESDRRFISGLPREHKWIRLTPSEEMPLEGIRVLAEKSNLFCRIERDSFVVVSGSDDKLKDFVKKIAAQHKKKSASEH
jgi:hypothetical protein